MEKLKLGFLISIITVIFVFVYYITYTFIEPTAYDFMTKYFVAKIHDKKKAIGGNDNIVLIVVDDKTIGRYQWPWKREKWRLIYNYLYEYAKPKVIVHDGLILNLDRENPDSDKKFLQTINKFDNLVMSYSPDGKQWDNPSEGRHYDLNFLKKYAMTPEIKSANVSKIGKIYQSMLKIPEPFLNVVKHIGSVRVFPSFINGNLALNVRGEIHRNYEYFINYKGKILPSIALETFLLANNNPKMVITDKYLEFPELNYKIRHRITQYQAIVPLKFYAAKYDESTYSHKKFSAVDIMDSYENLKIGAKTLVDPKEFEDKIVLIGANAGAAGTSDKLPTSVSGNQPGVDLQATAIDNIVNNDFLKILPDWFNILITIVLLISVYLISKYNSIEKSITYIILMLLAYIAVTCACFHFCIIINLVTPIVVSLLGVVAAYTNKYFVENKNKEKVKAVMGMYMSTDVVEKVLQNIDDLGLGGKKTTVTVLFSDIRGFTSLSENMTAQEVSELLNEYFGAMEPIVTKHNGIINKFIGDAIMAVFGEPIQDENHAVNAVKCGYEMLEQVKALDKKWTEEGKPGIKIGVGINTGEVFVGNIGSQKRMEYTVIGDTVNIASRLESYNKIYKTSLLVSAETFSYIRKIADVVKIPDVEIRGKANKIDIYEILRVKLEEDEENTSQV